MVLVVAVCACVEEWGGRGIGNIEIIISSKAGAPREPAQPKRQNGAGEVSKPDIIVPAHDADSGATKRGNSS